MSDSSGPGLPLHGVSETRLPPEPREATQGLAALRAGDSGMRGDRLRALVADHPTFLDGWAQLAADALDAGDPVLAYAFARTGYHRGLDRLRANGWKGQGAVPGDHEPNRGFLRSVHTLARAAEAIGESEEAERCETFLRELDPDDHLGIRS